MSKLNEAVKAALKVWNISSFRFLKDQISATKEELLDVQKLTISKGLSKKLFLKELAVNDKLDLELSNEESQLRDQYHFKWLHDGDQNLAFFHVSICVKR